jgi:quercetin dioxygenase-like cupin family protein
MLDDANAVCCSSLERDCEMSRLTIRQPDEGRTIGIVGDIYRFLATGEETDGRYAMFEAIVLPGGGPPPHLHRLEDETFYVLEGEIAFQVGDENLIAGPGTFVNMPIGQPHAFKNETDQIAKMLITYAPAGLEEYFFEVGQPFAGELPPKPTQKEIEKLMEAAPKYGIEFLSEGSDDEP